MINNNDIHETINQILLGLKEKGMTESSIKSGYLGVYNTFLKYLDQNKISEVSEEVCIQYIESVNQIRLPSLLTVTSDDSLNRRIRPLVILLRYLETGSLDLRIRGKKVPFSCPAALASAYEAFITETEKSHLATDTKSTIINSVQRFILSVSENDQGKPQCGEDSQCFPEEGIICIAGLRCFSFLTAGRSLFGSPVFAAAVFAA